MKENRLGERIDIAVDEDPQNKDVARGKDRLTNTNTAMRLKVDHRAVTWQGHCTLQLQ